MTITKYRMILENGYIETLNEAEAIAHGNYQIVERGNRNKLKNTSSTDYFNRFRYLRPNKSIP
jgi:hypothetical protein